MNGSTAGKTPGFIWAERWNGPLFALIIMLGVPLLGWSGWSDQTKWIIAAIWFFLFPLYMLLEGRELTGQMEGRGSIDAPQARAMIRTAQFPYYGATIAIFVWIVAVATHLPSFASPAEWWQWPQSLLNYVAGAAAAGPVNYGQVEWALLVHTWFAILLSNRIFYGLMMELLKSAPRGERVERRFPA
ncbi:MAG TPA: hypothetical protein VJB97_01620 [Candidatus Paceibacterota bacterium]